MVWSLRSWCGLLLAAGVVAGCAGAVDRTIPSAESEVSLAPPSDSRESSADPLAESAIADAMTVDRMVEIVGEVGSDLNPGTGGVQFTFDRVPMVLLWDETYDRMRIISPVTDVADLDPGQASIVLEANFHLTLDARYATSNGTVFAAFIHPLSSLDEDNMRSGIRQVAGLVQTFGTRTPVANSSTGAVSRAVRMGACCRAKYLG